MERTPSGPRRVYLIPDGWYEESRPDIEPTPDTGRTRCHTDDGNEGADQGRPGGSVRMTAWPDFFIVGAPKSGTTSMAYYLDAHPDVFVCTECEPHYYERYSDPEGRGTRVSDPEEYRALFEGAGDASRVGDRSAGYLSSPPSAEQIHKDVPEADIIIMLRNPVEMVPSFHATQLRNGTEHLEDLGEALDAEEERRRGRRIPGNVNDAFGLRYVEIASYAEQVRRYMDTFSRDQIHVILFDDFVEDTEGTYRETLAFLGVDPEFTPDIGNANPGQEIRWFRFHRFLWNPPGPILSAVKLAVPRGIRRRVVRSLRQVNLKEGRGDGPCEELRERLRDTFRDDVRDLEKLLDIDLSHWVEREG